MKTKTVYYDALRGPLAVKPLSVIDEHCGQYMKVVCRVTAKNTHSGYKTGDLINCFVRDVIRIKGKYCYPIGLDEIKKIILERV